MTHKEKILQTLGFSEHGYSLLVESAAYSWAQLNFTNDVPTKESLIQCKTFWEWWNNQWEIRDEQFLKETSLRYINERLTDYELDLALYLYVEKHQVKNIIATPNKWVFKAVGMLIPKEKNKL